jgi:hypothetical protein
MLNVPVQDISPVAAVPDAALAPTTTVPATDILAVPAQLSVPLPPAPLPTISVAPEGTLAEVHESLPAVPLPKYVVVLPIFNVPTTEFLLVGMLSDDPPVFPLMFNVLPATPVKPPVKLTPLRVSVLVPFNVMVLLPVKVVAVIVLVSFDVTVPVPVSVVTLSALLPFNVKLPLPSRVVAFSVLLPFNVTAPLPVSVPTTKDSVSNNLFTVIVPPHVRVPLTKSNPCPDTFPMLIPEFSFTVAFPVTITYPLDAALLAEPIFRNE